MPHRRGLMRVGVEKEVRSCAPRWNGRSMDAKKPGAVPGPFACLFSASGDYFFFRSLLGCFLCRSLLGYRLLCGCFLGYAAAFFAGAFFAAFLTANVLPRFVGFLVRALFFFEATDFFAALPPPRVPLLLFLAADFFAAFLAGTFFAAFFAGALSWPVPAFFGRGFLHGLFRNRFLGRAFLRAPFFAGAFFAGAAFAGVATGGARPRRGRPALPLRHHRRRARPDPRHRARKG